MPLYFSRPIRVHTRVILFVILLLYVIAATLVSTTMFIAIVKRISMVDMLYLDIDWHGRFASLFCARTEV